MKTGKLLVLFKYVGIVQQALPLRVCRHVTGSKLAAAGPQYGRGQQDELAAASLQAKDRSAAVGLLTGTDELEAGAPRGTALLCITMVQAKQGHDSLESKVHASSKSLLLQACRDREIHMTNCWSAGRG